MSPGQRKARSYQRWMMFFALFMLVVPDLAGMPDDRRNLSWVICFVFLAAVGVIDAMRALAADAGRGGA